MLEASGGSGPPKARVLWGPIGTGGVNRRAVSLRSVFAHEPRVVFRDNKRATSSSAGTTTPRFRSFSLLGALSPFSSVSRSFSSILVSSRLSSWLRSPLLPSSRFASLLVDLRFDPQDPIPSCERVCFLRHALQSRIRMSNHRETRYTVVSSISRDSKNARWSKRFVRYLESQAAIENRGRQKRSAKSGAWLRAGRVYRSRDRRMKIHWKGSFETRIDRSTAVREIDCRYSVDG